MINVAIVDDHQMVVDSLSRVIDDSGIARIISKYYDLNSCRNGLAKTFPDILLLDISFPDGNGVDFCAEITKAYPELKIIMLTGTKEFSIAKHALHNGALGYILKSANLPEILAGIKAVSEENEFLCHEIKGLLEDKNNQEVIFLTPTEETVLKYIAKGYTTKEIANRFFRSEETVKSHRKNLFTKLKVQNMADLIAKAYQMKLLP